MPACRRSLFALVVLCAALWSAPAMAATVSAEFVQRGESTDGPVQDWTVTVEAEPGERNDLDVGWEPKPFPQRALLLVRDAGAPLYAGLGCRPVPTGVVCGPLDPGQDFMRYGGTVRAGDGDDRAVSSVLGIDLDGGPGDDDLRLNTFGYVTGGPGADRIDGTGGRNQAYALVTYAGRKEPIHASLNGIADDGAASEGDNLLGVVDITGGDGDDTLDAGATADANLDGGPGGDHLHAAPSGSHLVGGPGDDTLLGDIGNDGFSMEDGADTYRGGPGHDEWEAPPNFRSDLRISLDDVANDGRAGERDNVASDIETVIAAGGDDVLVGSEGVDQLYGSSGDDRIDGRGGNDSIHGDQGRDRLVGGTGADFIAGAGGGNSFSSRDGEADRIRCDGALRTRPDADRDDTFDKGCGPTLRPVIQRLRVDGRVLRLGLHCAVAFIPCRGTTVVTALNGGKTVRIARFSHRVAAGRRYRPTLTLDARDRRALRRADWVYVATHPVSGRFRGFDSSDSFECRPRGRTCRS